MARNTRKPAAPRKPKATVLPRSSPFLRRIAKNRCLSATPRQPPNQLLQDRIQTLLNEELLTCSICLQLLLSPVLAECGHAYCLTCAEDLAGHRFACGICHSHRPSYDLPPSPVIQSLLSSYLQRSEAEQQELYAERQQSLRGKEQRRLLNEPRMGEGLDYWCEEELSWKNGTVSQVFKNGNVSILPRKGGNELQIHSSSRKLAPLHHFSKEEPAPAAEVHFRPLQMLPPRAIQTMRLRTEERPRVFEMPFFLGYYWGNEEHNQGRELFDVGDPFNF